MQPEVGSEPAGDASPPLALISIAASDIGCVRRVNEDAWICRPDIGVFVVADGMGGHQAGDVASQTIIAGIAAIAPQAGEAALEKAVEDALQEANRTLCAEAARRGHGTVIGATVVALLATATTFICLWAGDSRLYCYRNGTLAALTRDHSHVQDMVDGGLIAAQDAESHPLANVITRAVGTGPELRLDRVSGDVQPEDIFLLCTDGLTRMVSHDAIQTILNQTPPQAQPAALIAEALAQGGKDNVTIITVAKRCRNNQ
jgi:serine/threonine-protein phosphatase Stp1